MGQVSTRIVVVDKASKKLDQIYASIMRVNSGFNQLAQAGTRFNRIASSLDSVNNSANRLRTSLSAIPNTNAGIQNVQRNVSQVGTAARSSAKETNLLISKLRRLAATYLGVMGARAAFESADLMTSADNKFTTLGRQNFGMTDQEAANFSADTMEKIFNAAQASAASYTQMMTNVAKTVTLAGKSFGKTSEDQINNAIKFQEIMAKSYALGGASAAEQASSMYQMVQALGSGVLQGDELRSVREGAPLAYQAIEKFAQATLNSRDSLKELASAGMISSDLVVAAILNMQKSTDEAYSHINMTWAQLWTIFKNDVTKAFQPLFETLRRVANDDGFQKFVFGIADSLGTLATILTVVVNDIGSALSFLGNNFAFVQGILAALTVTITYLAAVALVNLTKKIILAGVAFVTTHAYLAAIAVVIGLVVWYFSALGVTLNTIGQLLLIIAGAFIIASIFAFALGTAIFGLSAPILLVIGLVLLLLAMFLMFTEQVVGAVYWCTAQVRNLFALLIIAIGQQVVYLASIWDSFANFFGNLFNDPAAACIRTIENMANTILGILKSIASAIDSIFGSNLAGVVGNWISGVSGYADELVSKYGNGTYEEKSNLAEKAQAKLDEIVSAVTWDAGEAWNAGKNKGAEINSWMQNGLNGLTGMISDKFNASAPNTSNVAIPNVNALGNALGDIGDSAGKTAGNTGSMAKSMELTEDDLKYLRQIAEMEAINKFTTAEIKVEMTNNNTMNNMGDLDGIVTHLSTVLREELDVVANGTHDA